MLNLLKLIVFVLLVAGFSCKARKNNILRKYCLRIFVIGILFALIAGAISSQVPSLADEVTLTAMGTGEKGTSGVDEVYLSGYTVDETQYIPGQDMKVVSGKWFWNGEKYCWRLETDSRQPDGVTREVTVEIPVGKERTLEFAADKWRGAVQISSGGNTWIVDTYSDTAFTQSEPIGSSSSSMLLVNALREVAVFTIILGAFLVCFFYVLRYAEKKPDEFSEWVNRNSGKLIYAAIAIFTFFFMVRYAGNDSLWGDELIEVEIMNHSIADALGFNLRMRDATPPLFNILAVLWYQIAPYGEQWILLISIIPSVLSIYLIGCISEKLSGKYAGICSSIFMATATSFWVKGAYELRSYGMLVFFITLTILFYYKSLKTENRFNKVIYSILLACVAMTHYFGMLILGMCFISDLILLIVKKVNIKRGLVYIFPALVTVGWLCAVFFVTLRNKKPEEIASWFPVPEIEHIQGMISYITGYQEYVYTIFMICAAIILFSFTTKKLSLLSLENYMYLFCVGTVVTVFAILVVYGNFVNQKSTMWADRYFSILFPFAMIICGYIGNWVQAKFGGAGIKNGICLGIFLILFFECVPQVQKYSADQPYREVADWIYTKTNYIYDDSTLIYVTCADDSASAFNQYYISRCGKRDKLNVLPMYWRNEEGESLTASDLLEYDTIIAFDMNGAIKSTIPAESYKILEQENSLKVTVYQKTL